MFAALCIVLQSMTPAMVAAAIAAAVTLGRRWRRSDVEVARFIEASHPVDNLLVSAIELEVHARPVRAEIRDAIHRQAAERSHAVDHATLVPLLQPVAVALAVLTGAGLLAGIGRSTPFIAANFAGTSSGHSRDAGEMSVHVIPPAYTGRPTETIADPTQVTAIAGSRLRITSGARVVREWVATASESLELRLQESGPSRFLSVIVLPDVPPSVRITEPGRDTAVAAAGGSLRIGVESRDDLGLAALSVRYTKASGGGENVTFTEGELPLTIERVDARQWRARTQWTLDGLELADGDVLVYRAVARDGNPNGAAVESDAFLVEIGRAAEIAGAGFALPSEERKYAISQQMVIYKTEQLIANRAKHPHDWLEQTRMIGVEQRMVRAEVVFLSGGEVQDEVEEAAHSHELAEGRLENRGRAEMVRALNFMSRAEAQLNDGNATAALAFERQALASLERALDRRRYFLRTLPDRSRIDLARRLTGERRDAQSWRRERSSAAAGPANRLQQTMTELIAASADRSRATASLAARVAAVDPALPALQSAAVAIASARSVDERRAAVQQAMQALTTHALATLPASSSVTLPRDPLAGRLSEALRPRR